jgi:hypothetical protein
MSAATGNQSSEALRTLLVSLILVLVLVGAQFFVWPLLGEQVTSWQEARRQDEQLRRLQEKLSAMEATYDKQQPLLEQLVIVTPGENTVSQVVERLESLAGERGVTIQIKNITTEATDRLSPVVISLELRGLPGSLLSYLQSVEHRPELTQVRTWTLERVTQGAGAQPLPGATHTLMMTVVFYLQPPTP